jgi:hypothetical protein
MTAKTARATTPTTAAPAAMMTGSSVNAGLMALLKAQLVDAQLALRQVIAAAPSGDENLAALNSLSAQIDGFFRGIA